MPDLHFQMIFVIFKSFAFWCQVQLPHSGDLLTCITVLRCTIWPILKEKMFTWPIRIQFYRLVYLKENIVSLLYREQLTPFIIFLYKVHTYVCLLTSNRVLILESWMWKYTGQFCDLWSINQTMIWSKIQYLEQWQNVSIMKIFESASAPLVDILCWDMAIQQKIFFAVD